VQVSLKARLALCGMEHLLSPLSLIVHDLLDVAVRQLQRQAYRNLLRNEFGLDADESAIQVDGLLDAELAEHGTQNIVRACLHDGLEILVEFPTEPPDGLVQIALPAPWSDEACRTHTLIDALSLALMVEADSGLTRLTLCRDTTASAAAAKSVAPPLLGEAATHVGMAQVFDTLGYALIQFSPVGEVVAVSPSLLTMLQIGPRDFSLATLGAAIPPAFFNDIIWGQALDDGHGRFENYRIRLGLPGRPDSVILFNVSGFRQETGNILSLWQQVAVDAGVAGLSEGSMVSELRIRNITRHYVPQLVEEKAREAVRLGKSALVNEQRALAVLFCDIVGFTAYVESNAASESTIDTLNSILRRVAGSVRRHGGSIDKFMGDCIMALFDDPGLAIRAAADMQSYSADINRLRDRAGQQVLQLRIGIHWGEVVVGNVGTAERLDWTAIGDVVNTASRIEKACPPGSILISGAVRTAIPTAARVRFRFGEEFGIALKGKREALQVCVVETDGEAPDEVADETG
jgi:class 3 adenylate cyclase